MGLHIPPKMSAGSTIKRLVVSLPTAALDKGSWKLPNTFDLLSINATSAGRFRLYRDAAARDMDANRPPEKDPEPAGGCILDAVFTPGRLSLNLSPLPWGSPAVKGEPCFWAWNGPANQTLTMEILEVEP